MKKLFVVVFTFLFNLTFSQSYTDIDEIYQSYYKDEYSSYFPIQNCIIIVNHEQLLNEIKKHDKALVYVFVNGCKGENCKPLYIYENWARNNGYKLFLVMKNIKGYKKSVIQNPNTQLFVIDNEFYNSKKVSDKFKNGLKKLPITQKSKYLGGLLFFENGKYVSTFQTLPSNKLYE